MIDDLRAGSPLHARLPGDLPATYWWLWLGTLINRAGAFVIPLLALYLEKERGLGGARVGEVVALYGIGAFLAGLVGGVLADRVGRRATMTFSLVAGGAILAGLGFVRSPWLIGPIALAYGFVGEMYRPAIFASVADLVPEEKRARAYAYLYWAVNLGFAIAPVVGGLLARLSFTACFVIDGVTMIGFGLLVRARVPETVSATRGPTPTPASPRPSSGLGVVFADRPFVGLAATNVLIAVLVWGSSVVLPLQMSSLGHSPAAYGLVAATNGALIVLLQPFTTELARRRSARTILVVSSLLFAVGFGLNGRVSTVPLFMLAAAIWTLGEIIATPVMSALVAGMAPPDQRGRYQGVLGASWALAAVLGPLGGGRMIAPLGFPRLWAVAFGVGVCAAIGFALVGRACEARLSGGSTSRTSGAA